MDKELEAAERRIKKTTDSEFKKLVREDKKLDKERDQLKEKVHRLERM